MIKAQDDSHGDIVLTDTGEALPCVIESDDEPVSVEVSVWEAHRQVRNVPSASGWNLVEESSVQESVPPLPPVQPSVQTMDKERTSHALKALSAEGGAQLRETLSGARTEIRSLQEAVVSLPSRFRGTITRFWTAASRPVHFQSLSKGKRPRTKLEMFCIDTVRFGGTFALIFAVLFVAINYQSFFQIARAELALGDDLQNQQALAEIVGGSSDGAGSSASSHSTFDLLASLPPVGPYEDRIVIPKLGKNVPIVRPSIDALMHEDWKKFEDDIQVALKDGVVHYPGSARPGQAGNFFVTGHSSYYPWDDGDYKDVFARLNDLNPGDTYSVYYGGDKHTYRVLSKKEVKPSDTSVLDQPTDQRISTLMTCTPVGTTLKRLIVRAEEIDPVTGQVLHVGEKSSETSKLPSVRLDALPI